MANTAVHDFTDGAPLVGTDEFYLSRSPFGVGDDRRGSLSAVLTFIQNNISTVLNLSGSAYTIVGGSTSSSTNGSNLISAYAAAKLATPHGAALSATNRFTIFLLPGRFTVTGDALVLDTQFIDLVGLSTNAGSWAWNSLTLAGVLLGDTVIESTGNTLGVTAAGDTDVTVMNISLTTSAAGSRAFNPTTQGLQFKLVNSVVTNSSGQGNAAMAADVSFLGQYIDVRCWNTRSFAFRLSGTANATGTFIRCKAGEFSFGSALSDGVAGNASGLFIDCEADGASFGRNIASGTFLRCRFVNISGTAAGMFGFGAGSNASGLFVGCDTGGNVSNCFGVGSTSGTFIDCRASVAAFSAGGAGTTFSGTWINCVGGDNSFGGGQSTASGTFRNCVGGNGSFGGSTATGGTASGTFYNCVGGNGSFGGGVTTGGTASGTFRYCTGGTNCFGSGGTTNGTLSGTVVNCSMLGHMRVALTGRLEGMRIVATAANTTALQVASGSTGSVYDCTIVGTGTGLSIDVISGTPTIAIAHCRLNKGIGASVSNSVATPYNVDDANIA